MTKQEFLSALGEKLKEGMTSAQIISQVRYYEGYIDGEIAKGKTEEEAVADLGDPILIARNILESPREEVDSIFGPSVEDQEDAYEEGSYQGENQHSEEEVRQAVREDVPLGETSRSSELHRDEAGNQNTGESGTEKEAFGENAHQQKRAKSDSSTAYEHAGTRRRSFEEREREDSHNGNIPIHGKEDFQDSDHSEEKASQKYHSTDNTQKRYTESSQERRSGHFDEERESVHGNERESEQRANEERDETVKSGTGLFHDEHGRFRWDLLGVILAFAIGLTAVIWLVTKIVTALNPIVIVIILVLIVAFLVIRYRS